MEDEDYKIKIRNGINIVKNNGYCLKTDGVWCALCLLSKPLDDSHCCCEFALLDPDYKILKIFPRKIKKELKQIITDENIFDRML